MIRELKALLTPPTLPSRPHDHASNPPLRPFGVDLALPAVGGTARKTNHDYTGGQLAELIDAIVDEEATLFVSAVGVPPPWVIEKLHASGVVVMNMVGHPRHAEKAFEAGADLVCAQGGEGGGHTGEIPMHILVPACVDVARRYRPRMLRGGEGMVVAAGGVWDGRGLAAALAMGAVGVWVGTRFVASEEAGCSDAHKAAVLEAGWEDTVRTLVVSGRPLRVRRNEYVDGWERREKEMKDDCARGVVPMEKDWEEGREVDLPFLMGQVSAVVKDVKPAGEIVETMVREAVEHLGRAGDYVDNGRGRSKL